MCNLNPKRSGMALDNHFLKTTGSLPFLRGARALGAGVFLAFGLGAGEVAASTLPSLIEEVTAAHPSVRSQRAQGRASQEAVNAARWQFYPTPSISVEAAGASSQDLSYRFGSSSVTVLRLQQTLWSGGRLTAGMTKAEAGVQAGMASLDVARHDVALRVVQTYVEWYGSHLKLVALERSLETHARLRQQIARRVAQGFSPESDLILLMGRVEQLEADKAMAASRHSSALARLAVLLGRPVRSEALIQNIARPLEFSETSGELLARAEASSPGVARLAAQARMIEAEIDERKADLSPEVYARAERQYGNFSNANASPANRLFVGMTTRFGAGLSVLSQVDGARARYEAALADVEGARMSTRDQVVADHVAAESFKQRVGLLVSSLRTFEAISYTWNRQFVAGRKTWLDVMNSARELSQMEVQLGDVYAERLLVTWRLGIAVRGIDGSMALAGAAGSSP